MKDEAITELFAFIKNGTSPYHVVDCCSRKLKQAGFLVRAEHIGSDVYRKVELNLKSGDVLVTADNKRINLRTV